MFNPSLSYEIDQLDPLADTSRDEPYRIPQLRACLRCVASSTNLPLMDAASDRSLGALLAARRDSHLGAIVLASVFDSASQKPPRVCLIGSGVTEISIDEADELDERKRTHAIAISGTDKLAIRRDTVEATRVYMEVPASVCGGSKPGTMEVERSGGESAKLHIMSASGTRKLIPSSQVPKTILDRLFDATLCKFEKKDRVPKKSMDAPDYIKEAIVDFLERKVRLQALLTASVPAPASRPVVVESAFIKSFDNSKRLALQVKVGLHRSSSVCICKGHGLHHTGDGKVEITLETCGRMLTNNPCGNIVCPCHHNAVNSEGNARFTLDGCCVDGTRITVACIHRNGSQFKRGIYLDEVCLNDADREELSSILTNLMKFTGSTMNCFEKGKPSDVKQLVRSQKLLEEELKKSVEEAQIAQLTGEDAEVTNARDMLQRDMAVVDLLRGRGVFRHKVSRGPRKGCPYLKRQRGDSLTKYQNELVDTHGHLFRKAM